MSACGSGGSSDAPAAVAAAAIPAAYSKYAIVSSFDTTSATKVADENDAFTLTAPALVFFGANGTFVSMQLAAGNYNATTALFGDPVPNVRKAAYVTDASAIATFDPTRALQIARENDQFTLTTASIVFYGANGQYATTQLAPGTYTANNVLFGDPSPGVAKVAYVLQVAAIAPFDPTLAIEIAIEDTPFTLTASSIVYFGAKGVYATRQLAAGTYYASDVIFGDPIPGAFKAAYVMGSTAITPFDVTKALKVAGENASFTLTSDGTVFFGLQDAYSSKVLTAGTYQATTALFGDPAPGSFKSAYVMDASLVTPFDAASATKIASESSAFYLSSTALVFFGANGSYTSKQLASGTYTADTATFGDPTPGIAKGAYVMSTAGVPQFDATHAIELAAEGGQFTLQYESIVFFGTGSAYSSRLLQPGTYTANTTLFADLDPYLSKAAYILTTDIGPTASAPPTIVTPPASVVVTGGLPVTFSVDSASQTMVTYQWTRNGGPIDGATTSTYTVFAAQLADSGAQFAVVVTNNAGTTQSAIATLTVNATAGQAATAARPFSDQSFWNSRPTSFTLGTYQIPSSYYYPLVAEGSLSVGAFPSSASDGPTSVMGPAGGPGIYIADAETYVPQITIPHWPANVVPASGGDGEADIVDVANNRIHSFYQLTKDANGQWRAGQYTWTALDGRGFGTPAAYLQGSRAAGVVPIAGLIRTAEINDGLLLYKHALAMSLMTTALSGNPTYVFPATSADRYSSTNHTGSIPEGALLMLPASFDLSTIQDPQLLKVARTLQTYGGYVVDENTGTPFVIYVELGSGFNLMPNGWNGEIASELDLIRANLRQVTAPSNWVDANGAPFTPDQNLNLLSLRGSWYVQKGSTAGTFDTWTQSVVFPSNGVFTQQTNTTGRSMPLSLWGAPIANHAYRLAVNANGGATMQLTLVDGNGQPLYSTPELGDGSVQIVNWPADATVMPWVRLSSGPSGGGAVTATLTAQ